MKILKALFEESLKASINDSGNVEFGNSDAEFTPVAVLNSDPTVYEAEYRGWLNDSWLAGNRQRLNSILEMPSNKGRFRGLARSVSANRVVPLVGSGMSKPAGLPLWREFLHGLSKSGGISANRLDALLADGRYEEAAGLQAEELGRQLFDERIEHDLRVDDSNAITGPVRLLPELFPNLVLTTNLDDILESVYQFSDHPFKHVLAGTNLARFRQLHASGENVLLKLHGDCRLSEGRVITVNEYDKAYSADAPCREAISLIFRTRPLLWIGCSLTLDRNVALASEIAGKDANTPRHYAFLQLADENTRVEREKVLSRRQIFPIWYEGDHDEAIEALLVGLLYELERFAKKGLV